MRQPKQERKPKKAKVHSDCGRPWSEHTIVKTGRGADWVCPRGDDKR